MGVDTDGDVQVAVRRANRSRIALAPHSQPRSRPRARRNPDFHRFGAHHAAVAIAVGANIPELACSVAPRARQAEAHRSRHLRHVPRTITIRANRVRASARPRPVTHLAAIEARDIQLYLRSPNRLPEIDVQRVLQVVTLFRLPPRALPPTPEEFLE